MSPLHPSGPALSRFADGELEGWRHRRIARHVETCVRCRKTVAFIREVTAAMDEPATSERNGLAEDVLRRRHAGERVALWTPEAGADAGDPEITPIAKRAGPAWRLGFGIAAVFVLLALAGIYLFEAPPAAAGHSELEFAPALPVSGATVSVRYRPAAFLAGYDSLRLRVRTRSRETPFPSRTGVIGDLRTLTLHRSEDGTYEGRFRIEPGELFVAAAVEDFSGEAVDTNLGRLWDVLVADEGGKPSIEALESRYRVLEADNFVQAVGSARELTERYPDNPFGWALLHYYQSHARPFPMPDSLEAFHEAKLRELIAAQAGRPEDVEEVIALFDYARRQGDAGLRDSLFAVAKRLAPGHHRVLEWEQVQLSRATSGDPGAYLREIESLWNRSDSTSDYVVRASLWQAGRAGDEAAVRRWIDRGLRVPALNPGTLASDLDPYEFAAPDRVRLRRERLRELETSGDESRPLTESVDEFRLARLERIRRMRALLARDLAVTGDTAGALALLREAARDAWQPDLVELYAELLLAAGDTAAAVPLVGLLSVDPVSGPELSARYRNLLDDVDDPEAFARRSAAELRRRVRASEWLDRRLPGHTTLHLADGTTTTAEERLAGTPSIIVFFQPEDPGIAERLAERRRRAAEVLPTGVQLLFVAEGPNAEVSEEIPADELVYDPEQTIAQHLRAFYVLGAVVLDADLTASVRPADFESALRIAGSL